MNVNDGPASPLGAGHARGGQVQAGTMAWPQAGFIIFAFAAPSACVGVSYSVGMAGLLGGPIICVLLTAASIGGSLMLLEMRLVLKDAHTLGDLGFQVLGRRGQVWGNCIQLGNFVLFLPVALLLCATALEGAVNIESFKGCNDYYILLVAVFCLLTTQMRTLRNTQILSAVSVLSVFGVAALQIIAAMKYEVKGPKQEALWFGNPETHIATGFSQAMLGTTTAAWCYVPAFLTVELATCMREPSGLKKSLYLSGVLNVVVYVGVGVLVVARWGYNVADPITFTPVWEADNWINKALNWLLLIGNFVSYMLDSVPLGRYCQRVWKPDFKDGWSAQEVLTYLACTLPTFLFGLLLSVMVPNLFVLLAFTTALTVPWVTQIYPAVLYYKLFFSQSPDRGVCNAFLAPPKRTSSVEKAGVIAVFMIGVVSFAVCFAAAVGKVAITELRGASQIGCGNWIIWQG